MSLHGNNPYLVSVIIPVYNVLPYLRAALDSVTGQTYPFLEILIVDDGSTDGSGEICDEYKEKDRRIRVIHQENRGLSAARNTGLNLMIGDLVSFLDADDWFHMDMIEKMVSAIREDSADIAICMFERRDHYQKALTSKVVSARDGFATLFSQGIGFSACNKVYHRKLWNDVRFPEGRNFEDAAVLHRVIFRAERISLLDEKLVFRRIRSGSITQSCSVKGAEDWIWAYLQLPRYIRSKVPEEYTEEECNAAYYLAFRRTMSRYSQLYYIDPRDSSAARNLLRKSVIELKKEIKTLRFVDSVAYWTIRCCPFAVPILWQRYRRMKQVILHIKDKMALRKS